MCAIRAVPGGRSSIVACIGKMLAILNAILRSKKPVDPKRAVT